jgi:ribosome-binding protein aMBF1 (putative translation factor)
MLKTNTIVIDKKKYVLIPEADFKRLVKGTAEMPAKLPDGNYPAIPAIEAAIAQSMVRDRQAVGMTQAELAQAAGISVDVLDLAERGVSVPSVSKMTKIEKALVKAGLKRKKAI